MAGTKPGHDEKGIGGATVVFYVVASAILAATLYYFHTRPDRSRRAE
jgi:hypothetical protein